MWYGNNFVVDRVQNAGVTNSGVTRTRIYEDGNPNAVDTNIDTPNLTYELESWDLTTDIEAMLVGLNPSSVNDGDVIDLTDNKPMDVTSRLRAQLHSTSIGGSLVIPSLYLESASWRFGVRQNAGETFTMRGDSQYVIPGVAYRQTFAKSGSGGGTGPYTLTNAAIEHVESGESIFVLGLCWIDTDGTYRRLFHGFDYTDTTNNFTLTAAAAAAMPGTASLHAVYGSTVGATVAEQITSTTAVKPGSLRAKDIDVYVSDGAATPTLIRWDGVQSAEANWRVTLTAEEELGNPHYVSQDYDVPDVSGQLTVRPKDIATLIAKISQATGVPANQVSGLLADTPLEMEIRAHHPETGARLKTLYVPDALFSVPPIAARANSVLEVNFPYQSEQGLLSVYKGARP